MLKSMMPCINHTNFFLDTVNTVMMIHISCNKHLTARLQDIGIHPLSGSRAHGNLSDCRLRISITSYLRQIKGFSDQRLIEEMLIHWLKERGFDFSYILFFTEFNNYYSCYKHRQFRENILGCKAIEEKNIIHLLSIIRIQFHRNRSMSFLNPLHQFLIKFSSLYRI